MRKLSPAQRVRDWFGLGRKDPYKWAAHLGDEDWFRAHDALTKSAIPPATGQADLPGLPTPGQQIRFTGRSGTGNLLQAFHFYQFCLGATTARRPYSKSDKILDFGCGWGRIARFWLREVAPSRIWCIDCMTDAIDALRATHLCANIVQNDPLPPVTGLPGGFRLIYAFSVFSHLSEAVALKWLQYFAGLLRPGGFLIFTTRGSEYLMGLRSLRIHPPQDQHQKRMLELAPPQDALEARYAAGEYVFFGTGGGGELTEDFYGEAMIPKPWLSRLERHGLRLLDMKEGLSGIDQAVVVMQKSG